jgi:hypothetical protein
MSTLVADPHDVERLAEGREDENWAFRAWVKSDLALSDEQLAS